MTEPVRVPFEELSEVLRCVFALHGCSDHVSRVLAENCAGAERDGALSHGIFRVDGYISTLKSGWVDGHAEPVIEDVAPGFLRADANNGFTLAATDAARAPLIAKARAAGVAVLATRNSQHFSALWPDVEPFALEGFVAISMVNSMACVVPAGGAKPVYGTNPLAFAAPRAGDDPIVFDQAASAMANGDVQIAAREGRDLPPGVGVDAQGNPTTDPKAVLDGGALLPFGGYKGSSIAMMVEIMGAALTGGKFSFEVDWSEHPGAAIPHTGQVILLIDPGRGAARSFTQRIEELIDRLRDAGADRLPGDKRYAARRAAMAQGIPLAAGDWQRLQELAAGAQV